MPTAYVFVPGVFHTTKHFERIVAALQSRGYDAVAADMPSVGPHPSGVRLEDDIASIRAQISRFVVDGKDVVLVPHSYGGFPGARSVRGLERNVAAGRAHGIKRVLFISAFLVPDEMAMSDILGGSVPPWCDDSGEFRKPQGDLSTVFFSDMPPADAQMYAAALRPQNRDGGVRRYPGVCWDMDLPKTYLFTTDDQATPLEYQRIGYEQIKALNPDSWSTVEMDSGHSPFLSRVEETADLLVKYASV